MIGCFAFLFANFKDEIKRRIISIKQLFKCSIFSTDRVVISFQITFSYLLLIKYFENIF